MLSPWPGGHNGRILAWFAGAPPHRCRRSGPESFELGCSIAVFVPHADGKGLSVTEKLRRDDPLKRPVDQNNDADAFFHQPNVLNFLCLFEGAAGDGAQCLKDIFVQGWRGHGFIYAPFP